MAARSAPLTLDEFHRLYDGAKPAYEYWYGDAIRKSMPTILHGIVQTLLAVLLRRAGWKTASEVRLKVIEEAEPVPDLIAIRSKFKDGRYPKEAPELCIEILSPGDTLAKVLEKARTYVSWGSKHVWIVDPEARTAWTLSHENPRNAVWVEPEGKLIAGDTVIELAALFLEVDQSLESTPTRD